MKEISIQEGRKPRNCRLIESEITCVERVGAAAYLLWDSEPRSFQIDGLFLASTY